MDTAHQPKPEDGPPEAVEESAPADANVRVRRAVFPEALGVGLAATLLAGLIGVGIFAHSVLRSQGQQAAQAERHALADVFAAAVGQLTELDEAKRRETFQYLCAQSDGLRSAEWVAPDGSAKCRWPGAVTSAPDAPPPSPTDRSPRGHSRFGL